MPEIANLRAASSKVTIALVLSFNDATTAYGEIELTVMSQNEASQISELCLQLRQVEQKFGLGDSRVVGPEMDPAPWVTAVEGLRGRNVKEVLAEMTKALDAEISLLGGPDDSGIALRLFASVFVR